MSFIIVTVLALMKPCLLNYSHVLQIVAKKHVSFGIVIASMFRGYFCGLCQDLPEALSAVLQRH